MKALVDSREPSFLRAIAQKEYGYEQDTIEQGDFYLPEKDVVVERKEASDFASSTTEGRLSKQADRMIAEHEHAYLVLEGDPYDLQYSNVKANSLIGMQTSLAVKRGIKIIYTDSVEDTLYAVNRLFERHLDDENGQTGYVKTHDTGEVEDVKIAMLMQIDGISREKAIKIIDRFNIHKYGFGDLCIDGEYIRRGDPSKRLQEIDGIGPTLAERVVDAFN